LDWTLRFTPGDAVTILGLRHLGVGFSQVMIGNADATATGSVDLLDALGNVVLDGVDATRINNTPTAFYFSPNPGGDNVTFYGLHTIIRFDGFSNYSLGTPPTGAYFTQPSVYTIAADNVILPLSLRRPIPEPSTWALMLMGFGTVGCALRARRGKFPKLLKT